MWIKKYRKSFFQIVRTQLGLAADTIIIIGFAGFLAQMNGASQLCRERPSCSFSCKRSEARAKPGPDYTPAVWPSLCLLFPACEEVQHIPEVWRHHFRWQSPWAGFSTISNPILLETNALLSSIYLNTLYLMLVMVGPDSTVVWSDSTYDMSLMVPGSLFYVFIHFILERLFCWLNPWNPI